MTTSINTRYRSITYKESLAIVPSTSPNSPSLQKYEFDHLQYKILTINDNIHSQMKTMNDSLTDSITAILQKITDGSHKTDKNRKNNHRDIIQNLKP